MSLGLFTAAVTPMIEIGSILMLLIGGVVTFVGYVYRGIKSRLNDLESHLKTVEIAINVHELEISVIRTEIKAGFLLVNERIKELKTDLSPLRNILNKLLETKVLGSGS